MSNIALKVFWSNEPMPLNRKIDKAAITIPFGVMITHPTGAIRSVNGKVGDVVLNAADVTGSADNIKNLLQSQITDLSDSKLDKVDYVQHFRGLFSSYAALVAALPTALNGDYAHIDSGSDFDRMSVIWDGDNQQWIVQDVNISVNTDEVPEGSSNLYFKSDRVRQTALTGLNTSISTPVVTTDNVLQALGKLQGQLNNGSSRFTWINASTINGFTLTSGVTQNATPLKFAKKDGLL